MVQIKNVRCSIKLIIDLKIKMCSMTFNFIIPVIVYKGSFQYHLYFRFWKFNKILKMSMPSTEREREKGKEGLGRGGVERRSGEDRAAQKSHTRDRARRAPFPKGWSGWGDNIRVESLASLFIRFLVSSLFQQSLKNILCLGVSIRSHLKWPTVVSRQPACKLGSVSCLIRPIVMLKIILEF